MAPKRKASSGGRKSRSRRPGGALPIRHDATGRCGRRCGGQLDLRIGQLRRITQACVGAALDLKLEQDIACGAGAESHGAVTTKAPRKTSCAEIVVLVDLALG